MHEFTHIYVVSQRAQHKLGIITLTIMIIGIIIIIIIIVMIIIIVVIIIIIIIIVMIIIIVVIIIIIMIIKDMYCANEPMNMIKWVLHTNLMAYKQKHVKSKKKLVPH